jgi:hypothetical protein
VIERDGFAVLTYRLQGDRCAACGERIPGVGWESPPDLTPRYGVPGAMDQ